MWREYLFWSAALGGLVLCLILAREGAERPSMETPSPPAVHRAADVPSEHALQSPAAPEEPDASDGPFVQPRFLGLGEAPVDGY
jgi:hypothetical protein